MGIPGFRPRFKFVSELSGQIITARITQHLAQHDMRGLWMKNAYDHLLLNFPREQAEAWTPQMDISFEAVENDRTLVRCLIGPASTIWMLFAGGYLALTLLGLTGLTLGIAQHLMDNTPWGYSLAALAALGIGIMVQLERTGRARAQADMRYLKQVVDEALGCDCLKLAEEQAL